MDVANSLGLQYEKYLGDLDKPKYMNITSCQVL